MIDTHSHIYSEEFDEDRTEVIARAKAAGVDMILLPAIDSQSHKRQEALAISRPEMFRQMMGLHPTSVSDDYETELAIVHQKLFNSNNQAFKYSSINPQYIAIGEIGLDFYWDTTFREQQIDACHKQMTWAEELGLPLALHLRSAKESNDVTARGDAYEEFFSICKKTGSCQGIMHCFSGSLADARRAVEMGFLLGIGGVVTYKKSTLPEIVKEVGLDNIVLETDAPYLAPVPYRGRRNESSYVRFVAEKVAEILGVSFEEVEVVTTRNAKRIFGLEV